MTRDECDRPPAVHVPDGRVRRQRVSPLRRDRPGDINERAIDEIGQLNAERFASRRHEAAALADPTRRLLPRTVSDRRVPPASPDPRDHRVARRTDPDFDHDWVHYIPGGGSYVQPLHVDAATDIDRPHVRHPVVLVSEHGRARRRRDPVRPRQPPHPRRSSGLHRYQHIVGEQQVACQAGTVSCSTTVCWHAGQPNPGENDRWLYKIRLNPTRPQVRLLGHR